MHTGSGRAVRKSGFPGDDVFRGKEGQIFFCVLRETHDNDKNKNAPPSCFVNGRDLNGPDERDNRSRGNGSKAERGKPSESRFGDGNTAVKCCLMAWMLAFGMGRAL